VVAGNARVRSARPEHCRVNTWLNPGWVSGARLGKGGRGWQQADWAASAGLRAGKMMVERNLAGCTRNRESGLALENWPKAIHGVLHYFQFS
jgi:hypothetical protein